jgi:multicomponent Na+:H+ antiporter subunit G
MDIIRFVLAAFFLLTGLFVLGVATLGLFRLNYVLNRIHAAAKCDTLGAMLVLIGVAILVWDGFTAIRLFLLIMFLWLTNPVATHLIGRAEVLTNPYLEDECEVVEL